MLDKRALRREIAAQKRALSPAALRVSAITRPTAHMLRSRSVVREPSPGRYHSPAESR